METKRFLFYLDWRNQMEMMNDEQVRRFVNNLCNYTEGKKIDLPTDIEKALWIGIVPSLKINAEKYEWKVKQNQENGKKGGAPLGNTNARKDRDTKEEKASGSSEEKKTTETTQNNPNKLIRDNWQEETGKSKVVNDNWQEGIDKSEMLKDNWELETENCKTKVDNDIASNTKENSESASIENVQPQYNYKRNYKYQTSYTGPKLLPREYKQLNKEEKGEYIKFVLDLDMSEVGDNERNIIGGG